MRVRYLLEMQRDGQTIKSVALPNVAMIRLDRTEARSLDWTLGKRPVREHSGLREQGLAFRGVSGLAARLGEDREGRPLFAEGPRLFLEFRRFLDDFQTRAAEAERTGGPEHTLVLRALWEEEELEVEVDRFTWSRQAGQSTLTYEWDLTLTAYAVAARSEPALLFAKAQDVIATTTAAVLVATGYVDEAADYLSNLRASLTAFRAPLQAAARMAEHVSDLASEAGALVELPLSVLEDLYHVAAASTAALAAAYDALPLADRDQVAGVYIDAMRLLVVMRNRALEALGSHWVRLGPSPADTPAREGGRRLSTRRSALMSEHTIRPGETLQTIAERYLGSRSRWREIAELNGMTSPWAMATGAPIGPGKVLKIPVALAGIPAPTPDDSVHGTDLMLRDGDLVADGSAPVDVRVIRGVDNYLQALTLRLTAVQGTSAAFPRWGLPRLVGEPNTAGLVGFVASHARSQILSDPRTRDISDVEVTEEGDHMVIGCVVHPVSGGGVELVAPFPS